MPFTANSFRSSSFNHTSCYFLQKKFLEFDIYNFAHTKTYLARIHFGEKNVVVYGQELVGGELGRLVADWVPLQVACQHLRA